MKATAYCTNCKAVTCQLDNTGYLVCGECNTQNSLLNCDGQPHPFEQQGPKPIVVNVTAGNEKEFDEQLKQLGFLYESGKEQLQKLQYEQPIMTQRDVDQCYEYLYGIIREMRDLAAVTMQKLHFRIEN